MPAQICEYLKSDGNRCGAVALRGRDYCRHHRSAAKRQQSAETQRLMAEGPPLEIPELEDIPSIHKALTLVMNGLLDRRIESKAAGKLLYALQLARTNLDRAWDAPWEEVASIQLTIMDVMRNLLYGRIGTPDAGRMLYAVQLAMKNLKDGFDLPPEEESEVAS